MPKQPVRVMRQPEFEQFIVDALIERNAKCTPSTVKRVGNKQVRDGGLYQYTPERYGNGQWVSGNLLRRVEKAYVARIKAIEEETSTNEA